MDFERAITLLPAKLTRLELVCRWILVFSIQALSGLLIMLGRDMIGFVMVVSLTASIYGFAGWVGRARDIGHSGTFALLLLIPFLNIFIFGYLLYVPTKRGHTDDSVAKMPADPVDYAEAQSKKDHFATFLFMVCFLAGAIALWK